MNQSLRNQKQLSKKVTEKMLEKEIFRICSMDLKKLTKRIDRMTNPVKLEATRTVAKWCGVRKIVKLAKKKRDLVMA